MAKQVVVHLNSEEPFVAEIEDMPPPGATYVVLRNPKTREGRRVQWQTEGTQWFLFPWSRISFVEVLMSGQDREVQSFFREDR